MNFIFKDRPFPYKTTLLAVIFYGLMFYMLIISPSVSEGRSVISLIKYNIEILAFPFILTFSLSGILAIVFLKPLSITSVIKNVQYAVNVLIIGLCTFFFTPMIYHKASVVVFAPPEKPDKREYQSIIERMQAMPEGRAVVVVADDKESQ